MNFAIARGRARAGSWLWMSRGLPGPGPSPGWKPGSICSGRAGSIMSTVGTVLQFQRLQEGELRLSQPPLPATRSEQAAGPVPGCGDARTDVKGEHVGRVINSSRDSLALQTRFGRAASGELLSVPSGDISTAFTTIKAAFKCHSPAQYKITVNTLQ